MSRGIRARWTPTGWVGATGQAMQHHLHLPGGIWGVVRKARDTHKSGWLYKTQGTAGQELDFGWVGPFPGVRAAMEACEARLSKDLALALQMVGWRKV
jgi:hypothetical protein